MDLAATVAANEPDRTGVLLTNISYTVEETGHVVDTPVVHLRGRDESGDLVGVDVVGFRPYFALRFDDLQPRLSDLTNDRRVLGIELDCTPELWAETLDLSEAERESVTEADIAAYLSEHTGADIYHDPDPSETIGGEQVGLVYCRIPDDVGGANGLRGDLECDTFEADIPFARRFLISTEIYRGFEVDADCARVRYENWPGESAVARGRPDDAPRQQDIASCEPPDIEIRRMIYDIEVATEGEGFPKPEQARHPITAITGWDSYEQTYRLWGLTHDAWRGRNDIVDSVVNEVADRFEIDVEVQLFDSERALLVDFNQWVLKCNPDAITGYNADGFDTPYLIQRCYNKQARNIRKYSDVGDPGVWVEEYNGNRQVNFALNDVCTLDILEAYQKTQFRELDSYKLDAVAEAELGFGKTGLAGEELDDAWIEHPVEFFTYNVRDTQATVGVEREAGLFDLFENLREVTGAMYETAVNNGPMLDTLFLRRAFEKGLVLPTNTEPDESVYHGALVFDPVPGKHKNCVYPDLSSLYPSLFAMLNLGDETIIGDEEALAASEYTEDDCLRFPVDERPFATVPKGESYDHIDRDEYKGVKTPKGGLRDIFDPEITWFYALQPDVKESFIRDSIDDLIELKYKFSGDRYSAIKRITNSCYGVLGDSDSAGGKGSRLYNRRIAEGITLAGRLTISHTAEEFTEYLQANHDEDAQLVGGDTDSSTSSIPNAPDLETAWEWAQEATEHVDDSYDEFAMEQFGFDDPDNHRLEVELESLASALFYMKGDSEDSYKTSDDGFLIKESDDTGVRKRYAQSIVWDDDDGWIDTDEDIPLDDPDDRSELKKCETVTYETFEDGPLSGMNPRDIVSITGFEYVRSDSAQVTRDAQLQILTDILLSETPTDRIEDYLRDLIDRIDAGDVPIGDLARPKGIGQSLDEYGWKDYDELDEDKQTDRAKEAGGAYIQKAGPTYRGAKYADDNFSWEELGDGSKPRKVPIEKVRGDEYPPAYEYDSYPKDGRPDPLEVGDPVDAIAVEETDRIPEQFVIDYDSIIEKELEEKLEGILETMDLDWDDLLADGTQSGLDQWV